MTQQEKQEIDKKCDEFCEYRRTHSNGYPPREWFMAGVKALDKIRKLSEPETNVCEAGEELVEPLRQTAVSCWVAFDCNKIESYPSKYGKYLICRKDGKIHWETWNGGGWAYNHSEIRFWAVIVPPCL